ncbi:MAG TPA: hypothetical protein DEQ80_00475 [Anaerolinea thermolimosa]|uniref:histidine kinase n=1 Tax=Anaerolinea thermolimosa TaxID=229919 RepID=A0A3D1JEX6_9CHLR|nr:hypothetical protein [Anaerolinea thermolimosa]
MKFIAGLFATQPYLLPLSLTGMVGWLVLAGLVLFGLRQWWEEPSGVLRRRWGLLVALVLAIPFTSTVAGLQFHGQTLPLPGVPSNASEPVLMFLAALPWVLAAGFLGPLPAVILGGAAGLMLGLYTTHSPFAPLEIAGLALLFSRAVRQRYRTWFYRFIRHPLGAAVVLAVAYSPIFMLTTLLAVNAPLAVRLDYALTQTWEIILMRGLELMLASLVGEVFYLTMPLWWGCRGPWLPSPAESNFQTRVFLGTIPFVVVLSLTLTLGDWLVAGKAARRMVEERLSSTARVAMDSLPYFLDMGQSLVISMATPDLLSLAPNEVELTLAARMRSVPFFRKLTLWDATGRQVGSYPPSESGPGAELSREEKQGIELALGGVLSQTYTIKPPAGERSAVVMFLAAIEDGQGGISGVLIGYTDLQTNPFARPLIAVVDGLAEMNGQGYLLDENQTIVYPVDPTTPQVLENIPKSPVAFYQDTLPDGTRSYTYYYRADDRPWAIVMAVPAQYTQQVALNIAVPLLVILALLAAAAFILLRLTLGPISSNLRMLAYQAGLIARGDLDHPVRVKGEDEIGQLAASFEQMRVSLKLRLDELNHLLVVSQGVAANLEIQNAVQPILRAAVQHEVDSARIVLTNEVMLDPHLAEPVAFGQGEATQRFAHLDSVLYQLVRHQESIIIPTPMRMRRINPPADRPVPGALIALPVRHKDRYFGVFWLAYESAHAFTEEEIRFLTTLAGQISLAAFSARLYAQAEVGRQRLEAVLASTPEPVLVFDEQSHLLLLNQAALQTSDLVKVAEEGRPVREVVASQELADWLTTPAGRRVNAKEIRLSSGRTYYASVSDVQVEGREVGYICMLRDITHFKELDQLKSDFVATVSHDLRSPLTLMRGYAAMLQMIGELNDQQKSYIQKIIGGVDTMSRLVNHLLDLGRIEAGVGLQIEKVIVQRVIDEVIESLQAQAAQKQLTLDQEGLAAGETMTIEGDRALVQQAIYNLVENAIKYTPVGGKVKVRLEQRPSSVLIQVIDTGIGIAPLDLPRLFEKFYRSGRREAHQQRGTGLGLAIVKSIAERHNGRVWVESQLGKGSVFSLEFPVRQPQSEEALHEGRL